MLASPGFQEVVLGVPVEVPVAYAAPDSSQG
jgi:hypothetical protein